MKSYYFRQAARLLLALLFPILFHSALSAVTVYSKQSGSWNLASTWQGGAVPTFIDNVVIKVGHTVTAIGDFVGQHDLSVYGTLIYSGTGSRTMLPESTLKIDGMLRMDGGSFNVKGTTSGAGTFKQLGGNSSFNKAYVMTNTHIQGGQIFFENVDSYDVHLDHFYLKNATLYIPTVDALHIKKTMYWGDKGKTFGDTKIEIEEGATLTFEGGLSYYTNSGSILNRGTMICIGGYFDSSSGAGKIYNYGYLEFNVPANTSSSLSNQYVVNWGGEILKRGPGTLSFNFSSHYLDAGEPSLHVQEGGFLLFSESEGNELNGLWRVDAGALLSVLAIDNSQYVRFAPDKFVNNGTVFGKIKFVGDGITILEGNGRYDYIEIAKSGGEVTLAGSPEIRTKLTLTEGRMVLNHHDLRLGTDATIAGGDQNSYVQTNSTGTCMRFCPIGAHVFFPVGNNDYAPFLIQLSAASTPDFIKVRATDLFFGEYIGGSSASACEEEVPVGIVGHNWIVAEQTPGGSVATAVAYWLPAAERSGFDRDNCALECYSGGNWQSNGFEPAHTTGELYYAKRNNLTAFGLFGVYDYSHEQDVNFIAPLPETNGPLCEWEDLQLNANTSPNAEVHWTGPSGFQSNEHDPYIAGIHPGQAGNYTVRASQYGCAEQQASVNVQVYAEPNANILGPDQIQPGESVTLTAAGGTSYLWDTGATTMSITVSPTLTTDYQVTVSNAGACSSIALHTIEVLDASATTEAEGIIGSLKIAPNPAKDATTLNFESTTAGEAQLSITDVRGSQLLRQNLAITSGLNRINISLASFPAGTYLLTLIRADEVKTVRAVKLMGE
ncbi:MAG: T9SS type A sorting domain-containing protein [Saprospiraceae bacterium]